MAFLVRHGASRAAGAGNGTKKAAAVAAGAGARERKPRRGARTTAAKSPSKMEPGNGGRQLAAYLLALLVCICVAKLVPLLSSRTSSRHGARLVQGNLATHVTSDDTEGIELLSSWHGSVDGVLQGPSAPILPRAGSDPFGTSPQSDETVRESKQLSISPFHCVQTERQIIPWFLASFHCPDRMPDHPTIWSSIVVLDHTSCIASWSWMVSSKYCIVHI